MTNLSHSCQYIGIDVSKDKLDLYVPQTNHFSCFDNNKKGLRHLRQSLPKLIAGIVIEATGGLEKQAHHCLHQQGYPVSIVNPRSVRRLAQGIGILAKTDKLDAQVLARYGEIVKPVVTPPKSHQDMLLSELVSRRRQLTEMCVQEKNRLSAPSELLKKDVESVLTFLKKKIAELDKRINTCIELDSKLLKKREILMSMPGIGKTAATQFLAELPELGVVNDRKIAALVGVAPLNCESGKMRGKRAIWGGRITVRNMLFMVALVAARHNKPIKDYYEKLCEKGKPKKVALVACMRKILIIINHMMANEQHWKAPQEKC